MTDATAKEPADGAAAGNGRSTTPKYIAICNRLRADILDGTYPEGSFLPPEAELMERFDASRTTVRNAIKRLKNDNFLRVTQGRGTEVLPVRRMDSYAFTLTGRTEVSTDFAGRDAQDIVGQPSTIDTVPASAEVAQALEVDEATPVWRLQREKILDGEPFLYVISYLRREDFPALDQYDGQIHFLYKALEEHYGVRFTATRINITATAADYIQSRLLGAAVGSPLLKQTRRAYAGERICEYSESYCRPEYMSITVSTTPEDMGRSPFLTRAF